MYIIRGNLLYHDNKIICHASHKAIIIFNGADTYSWYLYYYYNHGYPVKLRIRGFKIKDLSIIDGNIVHYDNYIPDERLDRVKQMMDSRIVDIELCDYMKSIFEKINIKYDIIADNIYVYRECITKITVPYIDDVNLCDNVFTISKHKYKLEDNFALLIRNKSIKSDAILSSIGSQVLRILFTNNTFTKSARK